MKGIALGTAGLVLILSVLAVARDVLDSTPVAGQTTPTLTVDADPTGNQPTSLGPADVCALVSVGDTFEVDITVRDVVDLLAWEAQLVYDPSIVSLANRDVRIFQAASEGSNVFDASDAHPDEDGRYRLAAADVADPPSPDSGSGVLARVTLSAVSQGVSPVTLPLIDTMSNDRPDLGPILVDVAGERIGDVDGDSFFDGPIVDAWIAVDAPCPDEPPARNTPFPPATETPGGTSTATSTPAASLTPLVDATPTPTGSSDTGSDDDGLGWTIAFIAGGLVILVAGSAVLVWLVRRRSG